jgi:acyl-CoA thioester hydrolase
MQPDPLRLQLDAYPFRIEIPARFGDMDALRHLNNVALAGFYEDGRVQLHHRLAEGLPHDPEARSLVAQVTLRYLAEGFYPGVLTVAGGVTRIGNSSYEFGQALFQNGRCIGLADTVLVHTRAGRPASVPELLRQALESFAF